MAVASVPLVSHPYIPNTSGRLRSMRALALESSASASAAASLVITPPQSRRRANGRRVEMQLKVLAEDEDLEPAGIAEFIERSKEMMNVGGDADGPPRWFTPLDCGGRDRVEGAPLLLYLPGIDGTGLGLVRHHQRLKKIFDVWCLHIPVMDRTSFEGLLEIIEKTLRIKNTHLQNKPIYLVGESIGACLAFAIAAHNPDVDMVIISANPATSFCRSLWEPFLSFTDVIPEHLHTLIPNIFDFPGNLVRAAITYAEKDLQWQHSLARSPDSDLTMFAYLSFLSKILSKESFVWKLKMLKSASLYTNSRLHAVKAQTLLLVSGSDQLFPSQEEANKIQSTLPNCRIRLFKDCGHTIFLENNVDLVTTIKGTSFYRRSGKLNHGKDYFPPTTHEFHRISESYRSFVATVSSVMLSTLDDGKIVRGFDGIPSRGPVIFVGYHMLLGADMYPLVPEMLIKKGILLRGLGHPFMFDRNLEQHLFDTSMFDHLRIMGAAPVTGANFYNLLAEKQFILLYPGGISEALHGKGKEYKLCWPEQAEFVRMASKFEATIVPFGVVGEDDILELAFDYDDLANVPFYEVFIESLNQEDVKLRTDSTGEIKNQRIHFPIILPKMPGRFYYLFGKPIQTKGLREELKDKTRAHNLYLHVKSEVEGCLAYLKEKREKDPYRNIVPRLIYQATQGFNSEVPAFDL